LSTRFPQQNRRSFSICEGSHLDFALTGAGRLAKLHCSIMRAPMEFAPLCDETLIKDEARLLLRHCRSRLAPEAAGLPARRNRRIAGLNRDEAAELIGVSSTWYTQFELGKAESVSLRFVRRVSAALQLAPEERLYLCALYGFPADLSDAEAVDDKTLALLTTRPELPAATFDPGLRVVHANASFERMKPVRIGDGTCEFALRLFDDPGQRERYEDWNAVAAAYCGLLRMHIAHRRPEAHRVVMALADNLDFRRHWRNGDLLDPGRAQFAESLRHPTAGSLHMMVRALGIRGATRFIALYAPVDEDTAERLAWLCTQPVAS
jgi:transcriptional regulator with XRE-family HTH domain